AFVVSNAATVLRNDFTGWVGFRFTVGPNTLVVSSLGRMCIAGNSSTHPIKLVYASSGNDVPNGSLSLNMSGCAPGQFQYGALPATVTRHPRTSYYLVTKEFSGSARCFDHGPIPTSSDPAVNSSFFSYDGVPWIPADGPNTSYVPPS